MKLPQVPLGVTVYGFRGAIAERSSYFEDSRCLDVDVMLQLHVIPLLVWDQEEIRVRVLYETQKFLV